MMPGICSRISSSPNHNRSLVHIPVRGSRHEPRNAAAMRTRSYARAQLTRCRNDRLTRVTIPSGISLNRRQLEDPAESTWAVSGPPSKQTHDAVELGLRVYEIDPLRGDP